MNDKNNTTIQNGVIVKNVLIVYVILFCIIATGLLFGISKIPMKDSVSIWEIHDTPLGPMLRWDSAFYMEISHHGYIYKPGKQCNVAFYPLYPLLIRLFSDITGIKVSFSGIILSNIFLLLSLYFLYRLALFDSSKEASFLTILYISIFPTALFFITIYTESLFLLLTVLFFFFLRKKQYLWVFIVGILTGLTRANGVLLIIPAVYICIKNKLYMKSELHKLLLLITGPLLGVGTFLIYLGIKFNNPVLSFTIQDNFDRSFRFFPINIIESIQFSLKAIKLTSFTALAFDVWFIILFIFITILTYKKMRKEYLTYSVVSLFLFSSTYVDVPAAQKLLFSGTRYLVVLFPVFIALGKLGANNKIVNAFIIILFSNFLLLYTALFCRWYWAG